MYLPSFKVPQICSLYERKSKRVRSNGKRLLVNGKVTVFQAATSLGTSITSTSRLKKNHFTCFHRFYVT